MSKNTSPQARPTRKLRSRTQRNDVKGVRGAAVSRVSKPATASPERLTNRARIQALLPMVLVTNVIVVSFLIVAAMAGILLSRSSFVGLPATIAQLWLIANAAPVASSSTELGTVPLLPSIGVMALVGWRVHAVIKDRVSLADLYILIACVVGVPVLLTLTAEAMLLDASSVLPVSPSTMWLALARTVAVHAVAMCIGMGPRLWKALIRRFKLDATLFDAAVIAIRYLLGLTVLGFIVVVVALIFRHSTVSEVVHLYSDTTATGNLVGISALYLPNFAMLAAYLITGVELVTGLASVSVFGAFLVPLPPLPLFAAVPTNVWPYAWLLLILPIVVALWASFQRLSKAEAPFKTAGMSAAWAILFSAVAGFLLSGSMGEYGYTGPVWWMAILFPALWLLGSTLAIAAVHALLGRRGVEVDEEDTYEDHEDIEADESPSSIVQGNAVPIGLQALIAAQQQEEKLEDKQEEVEDEEKSDED